MRTLRRTLLIRWDRPNAKLSFFRERLARGPYRLGPAAPKEPAPTVATETSRTVFVAA